MEVYKFKKDGSSYTVYGKDRAELAKKLKKFGIETKSEVKKTFEPERKFSKGKE